MTVGEVIARLGLDSKSFDRGLKQAETRADRAGSKIGTIFSRAFSVTIGMGLFDALKSGLKATVGTMTSFNAMLQTASIGFTTMLGSAEKAQRFLDDMAAFAAKTPFEYPDVLNAAKRMLAYGFAADEVLPMLQAVGDATAALGLGSAGINRIILALGQMRAKGKVSGEEMRQLTEAGIPAWEMLAQAMGKTTAEVMELQQKGLIPADKAIKLITTSMTKRFGGLMSSMQDTWAGVTSTIRDLWRMTVGALTSTFFRSLNAMLIKVRDFLQSFYSMLQKAMGKKTQQTTEGLTESTEEYADAVEQVGDATEIAASQAKKGIQAFDEVHQIADAMDDSVADMELPDLEFEVPSLVDDEVEEPAMFTVMERAIERLTTLVTPAIEAFRQLKDNIGAALKSIGDQLRWFYKSVLSQIGSWAATEAAPAWLDLLSNAVYALTQVVEAFEPLGRWLWEDFLLPVARWTGERVVSAVNLLTIAFRGLGDWLQANSKFVTAALAGILAGILAFKAISAIPAIITSFKAALAGIKIAVAGFGAALSFLASPIGLIILAVAALTAAFVYFYTTNEKFRSIVQQIFQRITEAVTHLWQNVLKPLVDFLVGIFAAAWNVVKQAAIWFQENALKPLGESLVWLWQNAIQPVASVLVDVLGTAFKVLSEIGQAFRKNVLLPLAEAFIDLLGSAVKTLGSIFSTLWNEVLVPFAQFIGETLGPIVKGLADIFAWTWKSVLKPLVQFLGDVVVGAFEQLHGIIGPVIEGVKKVFAGLLDFINGIFTGNWKKAWEGVKQIFKGVFDALWGIVKFPLNLIIDGINFLIRGLNKISIGIPDWVADLLGIAKGTRFGFNIPEIPKLATGTNYVPQDMFAYLHEGEAVVPKKYNPAAGGGFYADELEQAVYRAFVNALKIVQATNQQQDEKEIVLKIDNMTLARMQLPALRKEAERQGFNLILRPQGV